MTLKEQLKQMRDSTMERMPQEVIQIFIDSITSIKNDGLKDKALQVGDIIPNDVLKNIKGIENKISELITSDFLILNFYRGGWCPYCNMELREYERLRNEFNLLGADIVGISPEITDRANATTKKNALSFPILTDVDAKFMKKIGVVFQLDEDSKREFVNFNMDFTKINGNSNFELPVPAVYVVNKQLEIVYIHFEADYMTRLEPTELLEKFKNKLITKNN